MEDTSFQDPTIHNHKTGLNTMFNHAVKKKLLVESPFKMGDIVIGQKPDGTREPYEPEQVSRIVLEGATQPDEIRIPTLIAAYGGQRLAEILDATTHDIIKKESVWGLALRIKFRQRVTGNRKMRLKTKDSRRFTPFHPAIRDTVLAYVERVKRDYGDGPLFPMVEPDDQGRRSDKGGRAIRAWIRNPAPKGLAITDPDLGPMHSFRHYVRTQMAHAKVDRRIRNLITGHAERGRNKEESDVYEHGDIALMVAAIGGLPNPLGPPI
jgi:integrase